MVFSLEKVDGCKNNQKKASTMKVAEYIPFNLSVSTIWQFKSIKNKRGVYRSKDCMKNCFEPLKEKVMEIFNFKKQ